jgi:hypothetical protein
MVTVTKRTLQVISLNKEFLKDQIDEPAAYDAIKKNKVRCVYDFK